MADEDNSNNPTKIIAAAVVIIAIAAGHKLGWWDLKIDEATIVTTLIAAVGLGIAWLVGMLRHRNIKPEKDNEGEIEDEERGPDPQWRAAYRNVVERHNKLVESRKRWIAYSDAEHARAEWLRLNSRAFRVALYFAVWSALVALLKPVPAAGPTTVIRDAILVQQILLLIGAAFVPASLVVDVARTRNYPTLIVALRIALLGLIGCAFINLSITLPYRQGDLRKQIDPITHLQLIYVIIIMRILILPVVGFVSTYLTAMIIRHRAFEKK